MKNTVKLQKDNLGFFYKDIPENAKKAVLNDFKDENGIRKVGMEYLVYGILTMRYDVYNLSENKRIDNLSIMSMLIEQNRVYVFV